MTAKNINKAFIAKLPVAYKVPGQETVECSQIISVRYEHHPGSGRAEVKCELAKADGSENIKGAKGKHIFYSAKGRKLLSDIKLPKSSGEKWVRDVKRAFKEMLPVIYSPPNEKSTEYSHIRAVIYWRHPHSGRIMVSCELSDFKCPNSIITVRGRYLSAA